ncbi:MAG: tol-pal system-associated acyl-CoA thioesterase [Rhodanobacteraceae bacterium]|jgi:acyl-CoA thioester hydrolase|nr:tol-pal system-associated acyl-CoA thioesterase [Rhodanobacteraceae bacterium]
MIESPAVSIPDSPFSIPVRIYWEDTDAGGVVYHARYLHFLERARSEWLRAAGVGQQKLREELGIVFVVHRMELDFNAPARLDDLLVATVEPVERRSASFVVHQELRREPEPKPLVEARVRIACIDAQRFRPRPIPDHLFEEIVSR